VRLGVSARQLVHSFSYFFSGQFFGRLHIGCTTSVLIRFRMR
jgi:hypothetical protein